MILRVIDIRKSNRCRRDLESESMDFERVCKFLTVVL